MSELAAIDQLLKRSEDTLNRYNQGISRKNFLTSDLKELLVQIGVNEDELKNLFCGIELKSKTIEVLKKVVEFFTEESIRRVEVLVRGGLAVIFHDRVMDFKIEIGDRGNAKTARFLISEGNDPFRDVYSHGAGFTSVVSMLLRIHFIMELDFPRYLILDESMTRLATIYVDGFFEFLCKVIKGLDFKVLFITHDDRFMDYGDAIYSFSAPGEVKLISSETAKKTIKKLNLEKASDVIKQTIEKKEKSND